MWARRLVVPRVGRAGGEAEGGPRHGRTSVGDGAPPTDEAREPGRGRGGGSGRSTAAVRQHRDGSGSLPLSASRTGCSRSGGRGPQEAAERRARAGVELDATGGAHCVPPRRSAPAATCSDSHLSSDRSDSWRHRARGAAGPDQSSERFLSWWLTSRRDPHRGPDPESGLGSMSLWEDRPVAGGRCPAGAPGAVVGAGDARACGTWRRRPCSHSGPAVYLYSLLPVPLPWPVSAPRRFREARSNRRSWTGVDASARTTRAAEAFPSATAVTRYGLGDSPLRRSRRAAPTLSGAGVATTVSRCSTPARDRTRRTRCLARLTDPSSRMPMATLRSPLRRACCRTSPRIVLGVTRYANHHCWPGPCENLGVKRCG